MSQSFPLRYVFRNKLISCLDYGGSGDNNYSANSYGGGGGAGGFMNNYSGSQGGGASQQTPGSTSKVGSVLIRPPANEFTDDIFP